MKDLKIIGEYLKEIDHDVKVLDEEKLETFRKDWDRGVDVEIKITPNDMFNNMYDLEINRHFRGTTVDTRLQGLSVETIKGIFATHNA